jgi:hypothetical protein
MQVSDPADEMLDAIRPSLPFRVRMLGNDRLKEIVAVAIAEFPQERMLAYGDDQHADEVWKAYEEQVKASYAQAGDKDNKYGFIILSLVIAAAISTIVQQIILWWWNKPKHRELMAKWQSQK